MLRQFLLQRCALQGDINSSPNAPGNMLKSLAHVMQMKQAQCREVTAGGDGPGETHIQAGTPQDTDHLWEAETGESLLCSRLLIRDRASSLASCNQELGHLTSCCCTANDTIYAWEAQAGESLSAAGLHTWPPICT